MDATGPAEFLAGVIEGFYGKPWTQAERSTLFDWMKSWGLNAYFYGPKDNGKHRAIWREPYSAAEAEEVSELIRACRQRNIHFIHALSPGLDLRYSDSADRGHLKVRFGQMLDLGCGHFSLLFDDIPDQLAPADLAHWGSLAAAQCHVANELFTWTRRRRSDARFVFCPTAYCDRMAAASLGGADYLSILGRELLPEIDVFWTGPEIVSREISVSHARHMQTLLRRKPIIWDNLHANDYDGRRFYCGPYAGRPPELRGEVRGLLMNPNCEFWLNFVPLRTFAEFVVCKGPWDERGAYLSAIKEWLPYFATYGRPIELPELVLLGDCYYLPHQEGTEAERLCQAARGLLSRKPVDWGEEASAFQQRTVQLRELCARMTELRHRPLFHALSRRVWDLREEMDLLDRYVRSRLQDLQPPDPFHSDFHLPGTYRGGMVARLQRLLIQRPDGSFIPAPMTHEPGAQRDAMPGS